MSHLSKDAIVVLKNELTKEAFDAIMGHIKANEAKFARSMAYFNGHSNNGVVDDSRTSLTLSVVREEPVDSVLFQTFSRALDKYIDETGLLIKVDRDEGYNILKYEVGGKFDIHVDDGLEKVRRISGLIYLNDDYEGGELYFPVQDFIYKPQAGDIVMFPSGFLFPHGSKPIVSGTKLAITTWFR